MGISDIVVEGIYVDLTLGSLAGRGWLKALAASPLQVLGQGLVVRRHDVVFSLQGVHGQRQKHQHKNPTRIP